MDGYKGVRALICHVFGGYTFHAVDELNLDDVAELAGAAQFILEVTNPKNKTGRRRR